MFQIGLVVRGDAHILHVLECADKYVREVQAKLGNGLDLTQKEQREYIARVNPEEARAQQFNDAPGQDSLNGRVTRYDLAQRLVYTDLALHFERLSANGILMVSPQAARCFLDGVFGRVHSLPSESEDGEKSYREGQLALACLNRNGFLSMFTRYFTRVSGLFDSVRTMDGNMTTSDALSRVLFRACQAQPELTFEQGVAPTLELLRRRSQPEVALLPQRLM